MITECNDSAFKHGLTEEEIISAWDNCFLTKTRVNMEAGNEQIMGVGTAYNGKIVEMVALARFDRYIVFHALTPPTQKFMAALGVNGRRHYDQ